MALTVSEELRIRAIEEALNRIQEAVNRLPTKSQLNSLVMIRQNEIKVLQEKVASLEAQVELLQGED